MTERRAAGAREQDERWRAYARGLDHEPPPFDEQWAEFERVYRGRRVEDGPPLVWQPDPAASARSNPAVFAAELGLASWAELHRFSVERREEFWGRVLARLGVRYAKSPERILDLSAGPEQPRWLAGAELNAVESCLLAAPEATAVVWRREGESGLNRLSFGELRSEIMTLAAGLRDAGFSDRDAIALLMPMTVECVSAYLAIVALGARVVSIADSFSAEEIARRLEIAGASGVVTVEAFTRAGRRIALYERARQAGAPRSIVVPEGEPEPSLRPGDLHWRELRAGTAELAPVPGPADRISNVLFSSGTTGTPKAIPWTHATPFKCAMDGHLHQDIRPGDVVAWPTNVGWMMGPWLIYASLVNRAAVALYDGAPHSAGFTRFVSDAGVTMLGVVPSLVRAWRAADTPAYGGWAGVRVISSTGEPSNRKDYLWLMSRTGYRAPVIEYIGGTEIGGGYMAGSVVQPASPSTFTTPALGIDIAILDESGHPVEEGQAGELFLIPPSLGLSQTLLNRDHHEVYYAETPKGPGGARLRRHGDRMGRLHRGFYKAEGRADDAMNLGGIKISSVELEQVIEAHDAVAESAAVAVQPEGEGPEALVVYAVLTEPRELAALSGELQRLLAQRLNPLFKIHQVVEIEALPRTASNKIMRRELRRLWAESSARG